MHLKCAPGIPAEVSLLIAAALPVAPLTPLSRHLTFPPVDHTGPAARPVTEGRGGLATVL